MFRACSLFFLFFRFLCHNCPAHYQIENLDRGVIAMNRGDGSIYVGWRRLQSDPHEIAFHVYRDDTKLTGSPLSSSTNFIDQNGSAKSVYTVRAVLNGQEEEGEAAKPAIVQTKHYFSIPLRTDLNYGGSRLLTANGSTGSRNAPILK